MPLLNKSKQIKKKSKQIYDARLFNDANCFEK